MSKNIRPIIISQLDSQVSDIPSIFPDSPFQCMIIGNIGAGKTTLLINLLLSRNGFYQKFNKIIYVSPTANLDHKVRSNLCVPEAKIIAPNKALISEIIKENSKKMRIGYRPFRPLKKIESAEPRCLNDGDFITENNFDFLDPLLNTQKAVISSFGENVADKILLIIDDCAGDIKTLKQNKVIDSVIKSRHFNLTTFFISQAYYNIPKTIRINCAVKILFNIPSEKELALIYSENTCDFIYRDFNDIFRKIMRNPHQVVSINLYNKYRQKLIQNLDHIVSNIEDVT